ncbi:MAG: hypothetical protein H0X64_14035, partial [Gemmatimonadaceae bacterium]|nr:hypothetical protein [Gemmatimonadaceae bacterium]
MITLPDATPVATARIAHHARTRRLSRASPALLLALVLALLLALSAA